MAGQQILKHPSPERAARGLTLLVALICLVGAGKAILYDTLDPDCFWHLRVADQLLHEGIHPLVDQLSYASRPEPWTPYSWLAELGMKSLWDAGDYRAAVATAALMAAALLAFIALASRELALDRGGSELSVVFTTALAAYLSLAYLSFRPVTAALLLLATCIWLMLRDRRLQERSRSVWALPPVAALAINLHPFALMLPLWAGALWIGAIGEHRRGLRDENHPSDENPPVSPAERRRRVLRYALLTMLTAAGCLCTPLLPGVWHTILHFELHDAMVAGPAIVETQSFFRGTQGMANALLLLAIALMTWKRRHRVRAGEWLWLAGATTLLLQFGRFAPLFALVAAPIVAATLPALSDRVLARRPIQLAMASVLLVGLVRITMAFPAADEPLETWVNRNGPDFPGYPAQAAHFVANYISPDHGRLVNEFSWGGYLAWRLGPDFRVLCDGRTQCYSNAFWQTVSLGDAAPRRQFLRQLRADAAILPRHGSTLRQPLTQAGWTSIYRDDRAEVLVPPLHEASAQ